MKLSDLQERVLISLVGRARLDGSTGGDRRWHRTDDYVDHPSHIVGIRIPTASALERHGLVEMEPVDRRGTCWKIRATDAGIQLCNGMGD